MSLFATSAFQAPPRTARTPKSIREVYRCWPLLIFLTSRTDYTIEECLDRGAAGFIEKPVDLEKLFRIIMGNLVESNAERKELMQLGDEGTVVFMTPTRSLPMKSVTAALLFQWNKRCKRRHRLGVGTLVDEPLNATASCRR